MSSPSSTGWWRVVANRHGCRSDPVTTLQLHAILETPTAAYAVGGNIATLSADYDGTLIVMGAQPPPLPVD